MTRSGSYKMIGFFLLFMLVLAVFAFVQIANELENNRNFASIFAGSSAASSHSKQRHPEDQDMYEKCTNGGGEAIMGFVNPENDHCLEILEAEVEEGGNTVKRWMVRVVKKGSHDEITAFCDGWGCVDEVEMYVNKGGYMKTWP